MSRRTPSRLSRFVGRHPRLVRGTLLAFVLVVAVGLGSAYAAWALVCRGGGCPSIDVLEEYTPRQTSKLYAADGRFISEIGLERRTLVKLGDIPKVVRDAFVITEDKRFYDHAGVDFIGLGGAIKDRLVGGRLRGASTITMQLAGNLFPEDIDRNDRTLTRKIKEAKIARAIEARYTKGKILELYLNQIALGNGAFGVETASQRYFGKSVRDLNLSEAATLAALPKGPERYNPRRFPDRALQRRNTIIELMRHEGAVSEADARLAEAYPLQLARKSEAGEVAPYFVEWVRQQLDQQFGRQLYEQGLKIYTTLDLDMQGAAERAVEQQLRAIEGGKYGKFPHPTYEQYQAGRGGEAAGSHSPYLQGAFVAMDPRTGAVRALVGGRDFDDSKFNRATQALRQPGSTFKPVVYADAIQSGRPPSYILDDSPLSLEQGTGTAWTPQNYDGKYEGPMILRRAMYMSRNIPTIRLGMELGEQSVIDMARRFGISTPIPAYPSIHIGSADVYPIEMIAAYTAFANLGVRSTPTAIVRVENAKGQVLWEPRPVKAQVLSPEEAWIMVSIMKDVVQRGTAAGSVGSVFKVPAGGKTGTTNDGADVWFIGYTADLVAGVWMGMDRPQKIKANAQGGILAAPAWTAFMTEVYRRKPSPPDWPKPEQVIARQIDRTNGLLKNPFCPVEVVYTEYYVPGTEPVRECDLHSPFDLPTDSASAANGGIIATSPGTPATPGTIRVTPGGAPVPQASRTTPRPGATHDTVNIFKLP
jgi:penicillin-binding protein 1A